MKLEIQASEERREELAGALRQLVGPTEVQPGCQGCRIMRDLVDGRKLSYIVEWRTMADLERHLQSDQFWMILALMEASCGRPEIRFHRVMESTGLETVERVLKASSAAPNDTRRRAWRFGAQLPNGSERS